jgi:hypothetical protein
MTARTVTVTTGDFGPVTVTEYPWCAVDHETPQTFREDICHLGPDIPITIDSPRGAIEILSLRLAQYPFTRQPIGTAVHMAVDLAEGAAGWPVDVAAVDRIADDLVEAARKARFAARRLAVETPRGGQ